MVFDTFMFKDKTIIVNPKNASWVVTDSEARNLILSKKLKDMPLDARKAVKKSGIFSEDEFFDAKHDLILGILAVTKGCNLQCKYCYADAGIEKGSMHLSAAKKCIDFLTDSKFKRVTILFHGGEPSLMGKDWFKEILLYIELKRKKHKKKKINVRMQTNATLIDEEFAKLLANFGVKVGISIDGPPKINDRTRPFVNGSGASKSVLCGLSNLQKSRIHPGSIMVVSRLNFDKMKDCLKFFTSKGIDSVKIIGVSCLGRSAKNKEYQITPMQYYRAIKDATDFCLKSEKKITLTPVSYLIYNLISKDRSYMCLRSPCGAANSALAFDCEGNVYPCDDLIGKQQYVLGNVFKNDIAEVLGSKMAREFRKRTVSKIEGCKKCTWRNFCGGGCAGRVLLTYNTLNHSSDICAYYKNMFPYLIRLLYEDKEKVFEKLIK